MKPNFNTLTLLALVSMCFYSCATICGGSKYNASILVNGRPSAEILHEGRIVGNGSVTLKLRRNLSNRLSFTVRETGCQDQTFNYISRTFRGWAFVGTLLTFTTNTYIPYGVAIDLASGALWKPDIMEKGISKHNYKNFQYILNYTGCSNKSTDNVAPVIDKLVDVVYLKNGSIIRGTILENDATTKVKIQTSDGSIFVYKIDEIEKITRE